MSDVVDVLKSLGFSERETKIYLALIKDNSVTAMQVSKKANIDRTTTYDLLEKLMQRGIVSSTTINSTKHFSALRPRQLMEYFKEKYSSLESVMPELNKLSSQAKEPLKCELFYGLEGIRTILKDVISRGKDYKAIGIRKEYEDIIGYLTDPFISKMNRSNAKETAIVEKGISFTKLRRGNYRYLEKSRMPPVTTALYGDVSVFIIWTEPYYAIRIVNRTFAKAQVEYFNMMWRMAKR